MLRCFVERVSRLGSANRLEKLHKNKAEQLKGCTKIVAVRLHKRKIVEGLWGKRSTKIDSETGGFFGGFSTFFGSLIEILDERGGEKERREARRSYFVRDLVLWWEDKGWKG